jgi:Flp pilus assembly protein TadG
MRTDVRGQALVETALVLPILLIVLLGIFDFGRAIYAYNTIANAAREAARLAIVDQNSTAVIAMAKDSAIGLPPDTVDVTFPGPSCNLIGCDIQVTVSHEWRAITPIIGGIVGPIDLTATTEMPLERIYSSP